MHLEIHDSLRTRARRCEAEVAKVVWRREEVSLTFAVQSEAYSEPTVVKFGAVAYVSKFDNIFNPQLHDCSG